MERAKIETGAALVSLLFSVLGLIEAWGYSGEGGMMPRAVMLSMVALSVIWSAQSAVRLGRQSDQVISATPQQLRGAGMLAAAGLFLLIGMQYLRLLHHGGLCPACACIRAGLSRAKGAGDRNRAFHAVADPRVPHLFGGAAS